MSEWEQIQRRKNKFIKRYFKLFVISLNKTLRPVIDELKMTGNYEQIDLTALMRKDEIEKTFIDLYKKVGVEFKKRLDIKAGEDDFLWAENMQEWCLTECGERIASITQYSQKISKSLVKKLVNEGIEGGLTNREITEQMVKRLPKEYRRKTQWMARRIVDTEVQTASNMSVQKAADATGLNLMKEWITAPFGTARVQERHTLMGVDGQTVPNNEDFIIGYSHLAYPGDPKGLPEDTINCHCQIVHKVIR